MCAVVTFLHAHITTKQTPARQAEAEVVVFQLDYEKAPTSIAGVRL